ncbi:MAG: outer membrane beta-barrel protein [Deltaproteobacteria bacterium]|nr:outer membrane beta-barrel protein [Deltaproteobacteria bacterium]
MKLRIIAVILCASVIATEAVADDFDRRGWYVGVGAGAGWDFLSEFIEEETGGIVALRPTGSFNARAGYRVFSWLAFEGMYEGVYGLTTEILGVEVGRYSFNSLLFNVKLIVPIWRLQPYFILGAGGQQGSFDGNGILDGFDASRWDPVVRTGFGLDAYVTKHWIVNVELTPSIRFTDWIDPSVSTDNVTLTLSGGVQYRF